MTFGEKLQSLRKKQGMSQEDLASKMNISRQAISKWELGSAKPDTDNIMQLSRLFGVTTDYLLLDEKEIDDINFAEEVNSSPERERYLAQQIYTLRTRRNLSQSELAELLEVSNQSISKWETGSATPDLENLIKMSGVFGVSLDYLVGETQTLNNINICEEKAVQLVRPVRQIVGIILLSLAGLAVVLPTVAFGRFLEGFICAIPFVVCGLICLYVRRPGIWCLWSVAIIAKLVISFATNIDTSKVWAFLRGFISWEETVPSLILLGVEIALIVVTIFRFYKNECMHPLRNILISIGIIVGIRVVNISVFYLLYKDATEIVVVNDIIASVFTILNIVSYLLFVAICVFSAQWIYRKMKNK